MKGLLTVVLLAAFSAQTALADRGSAALFGDGKFRVGCNYWASHAGMMMWRNWDGAQVEKDIAALSSQGIRVMRVFPLWPDFQPLTIQYAGGNTPKRYAYRDGEFPNAAGVDEEMMKRFRFMCDVSAKHDIKLVVGLLTGWMSGRTFTPEAFQGKKLLTDPEVIMWEVRFVRHFVKEMKDHKAIAAWDLGNECNCLEWNLTPAQSWNWMNAIGSAIRLEDASRPVVSGMHSLNAAANKGWNLRQQGELMDVLTTHPYPLWTPDMRHEPFNSFRNGNHAVAESLMYQGVSGKPCFPEEAGDMGRTVCSEARSGAHIRNALYSTWAYGLGSYTWWCAFDQGHLHFPPYDWTAVECDLGLFDKDFRPKSVLQEMKKFVDFTDSLPFETLPARQVDAVCLLSETESSTLPVAFGAFALARQAGFDLEFAGAEGELPDANFYILPSGSGYDTYLGAACRRIYERVAKGAVLLVSKGNSMTIRDLEKISGNEVDWTSADGDYRQITLKDCPEMPINVKSSSTIRIIPRGSEVLAADGEGNPFMTVAKYGEGKVIYVNWAIESDSFLKGGAYFGKNMNPYYLVYRKASEIAGVRRAVRKTAANPNVGLTEHRLDGGRKLIVAINYDPESVECPVEIAGDIVKVYRGNVTKGRIVMEANEAAIFEILPH